MGSHGGWRLATRGRSSSPWLLLVAVVAALPVPVVLALLGAPVWAQVAALTIGAVTGVLLAELRARRARHDDTSAAVRTHTAGATDTFPVVRDLSVADVRVHRAGHDVPYVARTVEPDVARALERDGRVLVAGPPMSGKTHLALHAIQRSHPLHRLFSPRNGSALHRLRSAEVKPDRMVVWLDDLERYVRDEDLMREDLAAFVQDGAVAVATISAAAYTALLPRDGLSPVGADVVEWFGEPVWLRWEPDETDRAVASLPPSLAEGARRHGLPAYLGGGPLALSHFRAAEHDRPLGHALVRAAADWRRAGGSSPVTEEVLVALAPAYVEESTPVDRAALDEAFAWATVPVNRTVSLLQREPTGYAVLDFVADEVSAEARPIPDLLWQVAAGRDGADAVNLGFGAATRHHRLDAAQRVWSSAADPRAAYNLGLLQQRLGDLPAAEHAWRSAAEAGDPAAMYSLGALLGHREDPASRAEAERWSTAAARAAGRRSFDPLPDPGSPPDSRIEITGPVDADARADLTEALAGFREFLRGLGAPVGPPPVVHVEAGAQVAYPEPSKGRILLGGGFVHHPGTLLHEYGHWFLEEVLRLPRDRWTPAVQAFGTGLAYYLPCSYEDSSRTVSFTDLDGPTALGEAGFDEAYRAGLGWAGVLWRLRGHTDAAALDRALLAMWRSTAAETASPVELATALLALPVLDGDPALRELASAEIRDAGVAGRE